MHVHLGVWECVSANAGSLAWEGKVIAVTPSNSEPRRSRSDTTLLSALVAAPLLAVGRAFLHVLVELRRVCVPVHAARAAERVVAVELVVRRTAVRAEVPTCSSLR
jgi:hypothetical protein